MAAPTIKNAPKNTIYVWDESVKAFRALALDADGNLNVISSGQLTAKRLDDGGSDASDGAPDTLYTAEYLTEVGLKVHVVGDGDKYVVSNVAEGEAVGANDAIPMAAEDGSGNKQSVQVDSRKHIITADTDLAIAAGEVSTMSCVNKFGRNTACGTTPEEIWDGNVAYTWPTTASITHIRSAVDSAITRNVVCEIQGLDANYSLVLQNATLDSQGGTGSATAIELTTPLIRVFRVKVLDDTPMDEDIWVGAVSVSAANASAIVQAGNNQTLMAIYTVPAGKTAYMTNYYATANPTAAAPTLVRAKLWARDNTNGYARQLKHVKGFDVDGTTGWQHFFKPYNRFAEKTDIFITGEATTNTADISAGFDLILLDN